MNNLSAFKIHFSLAFLTFISGIILSQTTLAHNGDGCLLVPVSLENVVKSSSLIVEAKVVSQRAFWNSKHNQIFTAHSLDVFAIVKGKLEVKNLEVLTLGGIVGNDIMIVNPSVSLLPGASGIFCLHPHKKSEDKDGTEYFDIYAGLQGFIAYDFEDKKAELPFESFNLANDEALEKVKKFSKTSKLETFKILPEKQNMWNKSGQALMAIQAVAGFSPTSISAGTNSILTINGSGFGAIKGNGFIEFSWTDTVPTKFVRAFDAEIVSWTDAEIKVKVPGVTRSGSRITGPAGTGPFRITTNNGTVFTSPSNLNVTFSHFNIALTSFQGTPSNPIPMEINLASSEVGRGFTLLYDPAFTGNAAAKASFEKAINHWKCLQGANFAINPNTNSTATSINVLDNQNTVMFDNAASSLEAGVLGRGTAHLTICGTASSVVSILTREVDFVFSRNAAGLTWNFLTNNTGISLAEVDFNTVALHEAGHTLLLGHSLNPGDVMFPQVSRGVINRNLKSNDLLGGSYVIGKSVANTSLCGGLFAYQRNFFPAPTSTILPLTGLDACQLATVSLQSLTNGINPILTWLKNGNPITNETIINNHDVSRLDAVNLNPNDQITLRVDACGFSVTSAPVSITGTPLNQAIIPGPISGPICATPGVISNYSIPVVQGAVSYNWISASGQNIISNTSVGAITANASINVNQPGSLRVRIENFCSNSIQTDLLQINLIPAKPGNIIGPVCVNKNVSNTYSVPLVSGASSYNWTAGTGNTILNNNVIGASNASISAVFGGADNLKVSAVNSCGTSATSNLIQVNLNPTAPGVIAGATCVSSGATSTFTVVLVSGTTQYNWSGAATTTFSNNVIGANSASISASLTANDNLVVRSQNACGISAASPAKLVSITPATPGSISGPINNTCGKTNTYSIVAVPNAVSYAWTVPTGCSITGASTGRSINMLAGSTFTTSGSVEVRAINNTCTSALKSLSIIAKPGAPTSITGPSTIRSGTTYTFSVPAINGLIANWTVRNSNNIIISTFSGNQVLFTTPLFLAATTLSICVNYSNGCGSGLSTCKSVTLRPILGARMASENQKNLNITAYPNPTLGNLNINFDGFQMEESIEMRVINMNGKTLLESNWMYKEGLNSNTELDLNPIPAGLYILQVKQGEEIVIKRFVKE